MIDIDTYMKKSREEIEAGIYEGYIEQFWMIEQLEAENKEQAEFLSLAKEQMDAYQVENKRLKEKLETVSTWIYEIRECTSEIHEYLDKIKQALSGGKDS